MTLDQPQIPPTVGEIITALSKLDPALPLVVSTHYDNDQALDSDVDLSVELVRPVGDQSFWDREDPMYRSQGSVVAAVLSGGSR
ncbi:hypothetical protein ACFVU2_19410 [Leifsonia sp. NPDC058194]|uniref:hypothetical protein n=1 Tax=Leifsonia sp. NPDC058194 TaxID=3346374 RepID=UPI0036DAB976